MVDAALRALSPYGIDGQKKLCVLCVSFVPSVFQNPSHPTTLKVWILP